MINLEAFVKWSNNMCNFHKNFEEYNLNKEGIDCNWVFK